MSNFDSEQLQRFNESNSWISGRECHFWTTSRWSKRPLFSR